MRGYRGGIYWGSWSECNYLHQVPGQAGWVVLSTPKLIIKLLSYAALPVVLGLVPSICREL